MTVDKYEILRRAVDRWSIKDLTVPMEEFLTLQAYFEGRCIDPIRGWSFKVGELTIRCEGMFKCSPT